MGSDFLCSGFNTTEPCSIPSGHHQKRKGEFCFFWEQNPREEQSPGNLGYHISLVVSRKAGRRIPFLVDAPSTPCTHGWGTAQPGPGGLWWDKESVVTVVSRGSHHSSALGKPLLRDSTLWYNEKLFLLPFVLTPHGDLFL